MKKVDTDALREKIYDELLNGSASIHELRNELGGCYDARLLRILADEMVKLGWLHSYQYQFGEHRLSTIRYEVAYTKKVAA